jgi:hypothetical protein
MKCSILSENNYCVIKVCPELLRLFYYHFLSQICLIISNLVNITIVKRQTVWHNLNLAVIRRTCPKQIDFKK